jgi:hypothetical protein
MLDLIYLLYRMCSWVKTRSKESDVLFYISLACPFSAKQLFHMNDFLNDFFLTCYEI